MIRNMDEMFFFKRIPERILNTYSFRKIIQEHYWNSGIIGIIPVLLKPPQFDLELSAGTEINN